MKNILFVPLALVSIFALAFFGFQMDSYFRPKYRQLDNKVFKESEQYNDGMVRDLENLRMDYIQGDADKKAALRAVILYRFSVYPVEKMSFELRDFYQQLKRGN